MPPSSVIINSIPKSGTYLLTQLISALGTYPQAGHLHFNDQHYTTGTLADGSLNVVRVPSPEHLNVIPAGHCVPAHLTWSQALENALAEQNIAMFFMYRDPRDIVISYMKFAMYSDVYKHETEGHRQYHEFLCSLPNDQRRAEHVMRHRLFLFQFRENALWLDSPACMPIAFEVLYSDIMALAEGKTGNCIDHILRRLGMASLPCTPQQLFENVFGKSKTAMGKTPSDYRQFFDDDLYTAAASPEFQEVMRLYAYD